MTTPPVELRLRRGNRDRRRFTLETVASEPIGTMRLHGLASSTAIAEADGASWTFTRRFWSRAAHATNAAGAEVGTWLPRTLRRGGTFSWEGRPVTLSPTRSWREEYALLDSGHPIAAVGRTSCGSRSVRFTMETTDPLPPGFVLFVAFVVLRIADDATNAAVTVAATTTTTG
jgi:hypothetical protein